MGGCVEKRLAIVLPESGLTMNMFAVDGLASIGIASAPLCNFARAEANQLG